MENPFVLAVALLESRKVTNRFLAGARGNEPDSPIGVEKPIDWRLLVDDSVQREGTERSACNPAAQKSNTLSLQHPVPQKPRTRTTTSTRTRCPEHLTRGSCA